MPKQIVTSASAPTTGFTDKSTPSPLAQGIRFGNMLFISGQGPLDPETREVIDGDIAAQTVRTLTNITGVLEAGGATMENVVNMRVFLRDTSDFPAFNEAFREFMQGEKVTRTCVGVIPHRAGVNVEIDCVAMFDDRAPIASSYKARTSRASPRCAPRACIRRRPSPGNRTGRWRRIWR